MPSNEHRLVTQQAVNQIMWQYINIHQTLTGNSRHPDKWLGADSHLLRLYCPWGRESVFSWLQQTEQFYWIPLSDQWFTLLFNYCMDSSRSLFKHFHLIIRSVFAGQQDSLCIGSRRCVALILRGSAEVDSSQANTGCRGHRCCCGSS